MRQVKRLVLGGLVAGVGAVAAAAIPQTSGTPAANPAPTVRPASAVVLRVAAAHKPPADLDVLRLRPTGPVEVAVRTADPRGGPEWAVRQFLAERLTPTGPDGRGGPRVVGRNRCVQLGRLHRGRFGWLTADGTFRPATTSLTGVPTRCVSRKPDLGGEPFAEVVTTITNPRSPAAQPAQTILYGLSGSAARGHRLAVGAASRQIRIGDAGAMLAVLPASTRSWRLGLSVRYPQRGTVTILPAGQLPNGVPAELAKRRSRPARGAAPMLAAQAPDPLGGLPFGMTATAATDGGFCTGTGGRVVADRVGIIDYNLDAMRDYGGGRPEYCRQSSAPRRAQRMPDGRTPPPFEFRASSASGLGGELGEDPRAGRIARRTAAGLILYSGTADPDVRYLTFATPSDVRTIEPSGPARAFLIAYAGSFPTGKTVVTTTFRDGDTRRDVIPNFGW